MTFDPANIEIDPPSKGPTLQPPSRAGGIDPADVVLDSQQPTTPAPAVRPDTGTRFGDYLKAPLAGLVEGAGSMVGGLGSLSKLVSPPHYAEKIANAEGASPATQKVAHVLQTVADAPANALQWVGNKITAGGEKIASSESPGAQAAAAEPIVEGQLLHPSTWQLGAGATDPRALALKGLNLGGSLAPMLLAPEAAGARALGAAGKGSELATTAVEALRAGTPVSELAPEVANAAQSILKRVGRTKQIAGAGAGGLQMAEGQAQGAAARIQQMPQDQLEQIPAYQQAVAGGMTPEQARASIAERSHDASFAATLPLAVAQGFASTLPLLHNTQSVLSKAVGPSRLARAATGAALEAPAQGGMFVGQNAASIAASNAVTGENRSPLEDSLATFGSGALMGGAFGLVGGAHAVPKEPFPGAAPGSLSDAANAIKRDTTPPEPPSSPSSPSSQPSGQPAPATGRTTRLEPPTVPWVNTDTGEVTTPTVNQVLTALHGIKDQQDAAATDGNKLATNKPQIAAAWGIPTRRLTALWSTMMAERRGGTTSSDSAAREAQTSSEPIEAETSPADTLRAAGAAQDARLRRMQGDLDTTGENLAGVRKRVDQLNSARGEQAPNEQAAPAPDSLALDAGQAGRLNKLREARAAGTLNPADSHELIDLQQRDAHTARIAGSGERIPGVQNMDAFNARQEQGTLGEHFGFADLDNFKEVNDTLGHAAGDKAISAYGNLLADELGPGNVFHRGGDEFIINHSNPTTLQTGLERVRTRLANTELTGTDAKTGDPINQKGLGLSFGTGDSEHAAEQAQSADKANRLESGHRTERRRAPRGTADDRRDGAQVEAAGNRADQSTAQGAPEGDAIAGAKATPAEVTPTLPDALAGAKPRYKKSTIKFGNDVDRAAYIVAGSASKHHDAYVKWLADNAGMDEAQAKAHGDRVRAALKEQGKGQNLNGIEVAPLSRAASAPRGAAEPAAPQGEAAAAEATGRAAPVKETAGQGEAEVPHETSVNPPEGGIDAETTAKSGENQVTSVKQTGNEATEPATPQEQFAANTAAIAEHGFKAGDRVSFATEAGRSVEGTIAKGDKAGLTKDMGMFEVHAPAKRGDGVAKYTVGARQLTKVEPKAETPTVGKAAKAAPPEAERPADYGSKNKLFTKDAADVARERLRKKLGTVRSGLDPEMVQDGITMAGYHIEAGAHKFADYAKAMLADLGDSAKPYLRSWYEAVRHYPGNEDNGAKMSDAAEIEAHKKAESSTSNAANTPQAEGGVEAAAKATAAHPDNNRPEPTAGNQEAGNFKMGSTELHGLPINIEIPKGALRRGKNANGAAWARAASDHYGYFKGSKGADGEPVDFYLGPHAEDPSAPVFVIDQVKPGTKTFDEHKVMMGFRSGREARASYDANFPKGIAVFGGIKEMTLSEFKDWLDGEGPSVAVSPNLRPPRTDGIGTATKGKNAERLAAEKASARRAEAEKNDTDGFAESLPKLRQANVRSTLAKIILNNGEPVSRRDLVRQRVADGSTVKTTSAGERRLAASDGSYLAEKDISKTAMDYAAYLREHPRQGKAPNAEAFAETLGIPHAEKAKRPAAEAPESGAPIEDFGKKLGGARKDQAPSLQTDLSDADIRKLPLSKIWPVGELDAITDPFAAAVAFAARAEVPAKPRTDYKVNRWAEKVKTVRELARMAVDGTLKPDAVATRKGLGDFAAKVKLLQALDRKDWSRVGGVREHADSYRYDAEGNKHPSPHVMVAVDGRWRTIPEAKTIEEALPVAKKLFAEPVAEKRLKFEVRGHEGSYFINRQGDSEYRHLKEFATTAEALDYKRDHYDDLVSAWGKVKEADNVSKADTRRTSNRERTGADYRAGKDVSPESFGNAFGFRGVEFGNWVKQGGAGKQRQGLLNQAYDGLMDLASIVGVPPRALSLDGSLGLGLGSRGHGKASAHFEPDKLVINLTKTRGSGSLAHEWFHALDNYFARARGEVAFTGDQGAYRHEAYVTYRPEPMYVMRGRESVRRTASSLALGRAANPNAAFFKAKNWTLDKAHPQGVRPEVEKAFADLVSALDASPMAERAAAIDQGKTDGYWSRIIERAARSFENYVIAKMADKGVVNDYLANVRTAEEFARAKDRYPYLKPEELKPVADAFDNLFNTVQTREGENGNIAIHEDAAGYTVQHAPISDGDTTYGNAHRIPRPRGVVAESDAGKSAVAGHVLSARTLPGQLDLFAPQGDRAAVQAARSAAPRLYQSAKIVRTGTFKSGIERVKSWQDAAHIIAPLRKSPQEQMLAVVTDADGKPLAVLRHTIGVIDGSVVDPGSLFGAIAQIPDAKQAWFAHQHPSGVTEQSAADKSITRQLQTLMADSGISAHGMIVVAPGSRTASYYNISDETVANAKERGTGQSPGEPVPAATRKYDVPMVERALRKIPSGERIKLVGPSDAPSVADQVTQGENGVILLDNRSRVVGFLPMTDAEMAKVRTGDAKTGAAHIAATAAEANAASALVVSGTQPAGLNVSTFLKAAGQRPLDILVRTEPGKYESVAAMGLQTFRGDGAYLSRSDATLADESSGSKRSGQAGSYSGVPEGLQARGTPAAASLEHKLNAYREHFGLGAPLQFREIARAMLPHAMGRALDAADKFTGARTHIVRNLTPEVDSFNGVSFRDGRLYVDETSQNPVTTTLTHEFTHQLGKDAPELLKALTDEATRQGRIGDWQKTLERAANGEKIDRGIATEELTANAVGDALSDPQFLNRMAKRNPTAFGDLARRFIDFINQFLGKARDLGSNKYLTDVAAFRDKLADVLDQYSRMDKPARDALDEPGAAFSGKPDTFYSALTDSLNRAKGAPRKGSPEQWTQWLDGAQRRGEFKGAEREWAGLDNWVASQKEPITREAITDYVRQHQVRLEETMLRDEIPQDEATTLVDNDSGGQSVVDADGGVAGSAKFEGYTLPGGENYRELLLRKPGGTMPDGYRVEKRANGFHVITGLGSDLGHWPTRESAERSQARHPDSQGFKSAHFDQPNVLAHVRMNDRTGPDGEKILHVEEVQSDWHQTGRNRGYGAEKGWTARNPKTGGTAGRFASEAAAREWIAHGPRDDVRGWKPQEMVMRRGVPDAPFKKEWPMLAMKRVLRYAAEHGYDRVSWTTGEQQAERYDLSHRVDAVSVSRTDKGGFAWKAVKDGKVLMSQSAPDAAELAKSVGKDIADKADQLKPGEAHDYTGKDLKVGGNGMQAFYDKMLPNEIGKYVKKWGAKVGESSFDTQTQDRSSQKTLYEGPSYTRAELSRAIQNDIGDHNASAQVTNQLRAVDTAMGHGATFPDAMNEHGSIAAAERLGGKIVAAAHRMATVHSVDITPAMRESVMEGQPMFARRERTRQEYEQQLDRLFAGARASEHGVRVLDRSDVLGMLKDNDGPLHVVERKVLASTRDHSLSADDWRKIPEWLDKPVAVFDSDTVPGRLVAIAPELKDGKPIVMVLEPGKDGTEVNLLVNAYDKTSGKMPIGRWTRDGLLRYVDKKQAQRWLSRSGLRLPGLLNPAKGPEGRVLTARDLFKYRGAHPFVDGDAADATKPMFSRPEKPADPSKEPRASIENIEAVLSKPEEGGALDKAKAWVRGKYEDLRPGLLGALQTRHLLELMEDVTPLKGSGELYGRSMRQMDADREQLMVGAPDAKEHPKDMLKKGAVTIAQEMRSYAYGKGIKSSFGKVRPQAKELFDLMHESTLQRMDPSEKYERLTIENAHGDAVPWTHAGVIARMKLLKELAMQRGGDPWADREKLTDEVRYLRGLRKSERKRELNWPKLKQRYEAMDAEGKRLFGETRDWYSQYRDETEKALIGNIERLDMPDSYKRSMVQRMRLQFEEARREGVYFPLSRDGDYWVSFKDVQSNEGFIMRESAGEQTAAVNKLRKAGFQIEATGRRDNNMKAKNAPSGTFVREIIDALQKAKVSEHVQDDVYQLFLRSLPELSMRKHSIHRRNIAGFSQDAMRAFAKNGYHGAHQLARLRHSQAMEMAMETMKMSVDNWRRGENATDERVEPPSLEVAKADALLGEMQKRHDWIMRPTDQSLANMANSLGFIFYLGASPASAITNLTQTVQTTLPLLGAAHGWGKASRALGSAWKDAARTIGNMDKVLKNDEERRAFIQMQKQGDFSKTQAHTLAGLAEGNMLQTSPAWSKTMSAVSWMFHTAEVVNREAAGMAAFRLARGEGKSFDEAVRYAGDVNSNANFDYSAGNRPRWMQGNAQRIALQFKNYSVGMTWLFYRNLYQAMKAESPETRRVARRTVSGILGMTALLAGATGLPVYSTVKMAANAANDLFGDDDEPWNFDDAFHRWLADNLGPDAARLIAEGPTNYLTGANLSSRTSLANLWIHDDSQGLEGADAYHALLEGIAGPIGGIANNVFVGTEDIRRGKIERGIERMLPTATKNGIKALRYAHEGVNSMRGDPIVPDVSTSEELLQAIGFQPSKIANQWRINTALKNYTSEVQDRRANAMNAYALAVHAGDPGDVNKALANIRKFNAKQPGIAITTKTLIASMRQRARLSAKAKNGVFVNPKLEMAARAYAGEQEPQPAQ